MKIGARIKELMDQEKLEVSELAKRMGKSKQAIYDMLEKEDVNTSLLRELSSILNVPVSVFFDNSHFTKNVGHQVKGNGNKVTGDIALNECQKEIKHLKELLAEKERTIQLLELLIKKPE